MATNLYEYFLLDEADQNYGPFAHDYPNDRGLAMRRLCACERYRCLRPTTLRRGSRVASL